MTGRTKRQEPESVVYERAKARIEKFKQQTKELESFPAGAGTMRPTPDGDIQPDLFVNRYYDLSVPTKDARHTMDYAIFRLSKRDKRASAVMEYKLKDGYIRVKSGPDGMASVWDYDIVLMCISYLTDEMNRYKAGLRKTLPDRVFSPDVSDILKFCRRSKGGKQYEMVEAALSRLKTTTMEYVREIKSKGKRTMRVVEQAGLIENSKVISYADNGRINAVQITVPDWIYQEIVQPGTPDVLTIHPDFFLIDPGIARFLYRLARRAAGKSSACWSFKKIYEHSGSVGTLKEFTRILRNLIAKNDLPEYDISEDVGHEGPVLMMNYRAG